MHCNMAQQKDRLAAVSPKPNRMFGSGGGVLGFFDLDNAASSSGVEAMIRAMRSCRLRSNALFMM